MIGVKAQLSIGMPSRQDENKVKDDLLVFFG